MIVYVAGASADFELVRGVMTALGLMGHKVAYDWTTAVEAQTLGRTFTEDELRKIAQDELDSVEASDALILIDHPNLRGALVEVGAAASRAIPVYWVPDPNGSFDACIFSKLRGVTKIDSIHQLPKR